MAENLHFSNSAYIDWNTCRRKYFNTYVLGFEPRKKSKALAIGIISHDALAAFYRIRKEGGSVEEARQASDELLIDYLNNKASEFGLDRILMVKRVIGAYHDYYGEDANWEILAVEEAFYLALEAGIDMPMRLDLLVRERSSDKVRLVDSKLTYNFYQPIQENLNPQFPKYIATLASKGIYVDSVLTNQLRYREMKPESMYPENLFKRTYPTVTRDKIQKTLAMHLTSARQAQVFHSLPREAQEKAATMLLKPAICKYCSFADLCEAQLDGVDTDIFVPSRYKDRSYTYDITELEGVANEY